MESYNDAKNFMFDETSVINSLDNLDRNDYPLPQILGSWKTHYLLWKNMQKNYLLIKYENLIKKPQSEFKKISNYLEKIMNTKFSKKELDRAISSSSFDKLEDMEKTKGFAESVKNNKTGKIKKFFYLGPKNDWNNILDKKIAEEINIKFKPEMKELEYL